MKPFVNFFVKTGQLRKVPRRGGVLIGSKKPATITDHLFRVSLMTLVLGRAKRNLNLRRALEMALVHDLCELYTGDLSPYDRKPVLPKDKRKWPELFDKWPRSSPAEREKFARQKERNEGRALDHLSASLPSELRRWLKGTWIEYEKGVSREARFVKQINRLETLLQALEYGREEKIRVYHSWWIGTKERVDDPLLLKFMTSLSRVFPSERD